MLFFTLNREDFSFVIHLDRHSRTLMEWWPFLIFHRGGLRIKVINNTRQRD